ncbi:hypothetical protein [Streptomyces sp. 35G-GA-8]|uniref:hypothetical protein n=1 Tax=Streptomyces sp. 35G-GA-8 TaxID=2939434 RepID=UPI00201ECAB0|nr:hypothetical protein [Streptomyces sp. 35G-GA-8]MCL7382490.1 hypothetical protein [Streptomyces sp. 35G-GA-8]
MGSGQSGELALWLRSQRERRSVTCATMAEPTDHRFIAATLSRGARGRPSAIAPAAVLPRR